MQALQLVPPGQRLQLVLPASAQAGWQVNPVGPQSEST
jgi:hypothetical protein